MTGIALVIMTLRCEDFMRSATAEGGTTCAGEGGRAWAQGWKVRSKGEGQQCGGAAFAAPAGWLLLSRESARKSRRSISSPAITPIPATITQNTTTSEEPLSSWKVFTTEAENPPRIMTAATGTLKPRYKRLIDGTSKRDLHPRTLAPEKRKFAN